MTDAGPRSLLSFGRVGEGGGIFHEDSGTDEHGFGSQLHDQRRIGGGGNSAGRKIRHRQLPFSGHDLYQLIGRLMFFGFCEKFFFTEHGEDLHLLHDLTHVLDGMDHVTSAGFTLGSDHGCALGNPPESLAQIARTADERHRELMLVHVMSFVRRSENFGFVDVIHSELLQNLCLGEMADAALGHHGNGNRRHDLSDLFG